MSLHHTTRNSKTITNRKAVTSKSRQVEILAIRDNRVEVLSPSGKSYTVTVSSHGASCTCDWAKYRPANDRRSGCSHAMAAERALANAEGEYVSFWTDQDDAARQKRSTAYLGDGVYATYRSR